MMRRERMDKKDKQTNILIKNTGPEMSVWHFSWNQIGILWFLILVCAGAIAPFVVSASWLAMRPEYAVLAAPLLVIVATLYVRRWEVVFVLLVISTASVIAVLGTSAWISLILFWIGGVTGPMIQICKEWERAIVLRLGKFRKVKGPGLFLLFPFIDSVETKVDLRIRVTDFAAETTLTLDSVPITVDALCFWLVWDAEKAILEVENYLEAVVLSSQTALRAAISANNLSTLLSDGEKIEEVVRKEVDKKTTEWGITIQHIEITEIEIPQELQNAMSHIAQAEREKQAHIILSEAEKEIAVRLEEASKIYENNPVAFALKKLSVLMEGFQNGNSMVLVPSQIPEVLNEDNVFGLKALAEMHKPKSAPDKK
jgi:regulator of protease activity HflC (stomatin/prohibitin superfamily)